MIVHFHQVKLISPITTKIFLRINTKFKIKFCINPPLVIKLSNLLIKINVFVAILLWQIT